MTAVRLRAAFVAASIAWAVLLVAVPFAASQPHVSAMTAALIAGVYAAGSLVCHQLPERSYHLWTAQMPVCARCAGIYFGAATGAIASAIRTAKAVRHNRAEAMRRNGPERKRREVAQGLSPGNAVGTFSPEWTPRIVLALAVAPTVVTLAYEWTTGVRPSHAIRAAAGAPIGLVVAWLVVAATDNQVN
jgi:hypothetical protein